MLLPNAFVSLLLRHPWFGSCDFSNWRSCQIVALGGRGSDLDLHEPRSRAAHERWTVSGRLGRNRPSLRRNRRPEGVRIGQGRQVAAHAVLRCGVTDGRLPPHLEPSRLPVARLAGGHP